MSSSGGVSRLQRQVNESNWPTEVTVDEHAFLLLEILEDLYCISSSNRIYMSAFYIEGKVCNTSKCAIQVNKVGLKPTYSNTR